MIGTLPPLPAQHHRPATSISSAIDTLVSVRVCVTTRPVCVCRLVLKNANVSVLCLKALTAAKVFASLYNNDFVCVCECLLREARDRWHDRDSLRTGWLYASVRVCE